MWEKDGFLKNSVDTNAAMQQLEIYIGSFPNKLKQFSSGELSKRPAEGKWSKQEILGHLILSLIHI